MTILVTAMAGRVKLAATSVLNYNSAAENAAKVMTTLYSAEAEIMLELMPRPIGEVQKLTRKERFVIRLTGLTGEF
jgi:hypothetical protein